MKIKLTNLITLSALALALVSPTKVAADDVNVSATVPATTVTFSGFAPPSSVVFVKETGLIVGSAVTDSSGHFSKTIVSTSGQHSYTIYLIDNQGRSTPEVPFDNLNLINQLDTPVTNINLPPTIAVTKTKIAQGEIATVFGQSAPGSVTNVYVNNVKRFSLMVGNDGKWQIDLNGVNIADHSEFYAVNSRPTLPDSAKSFVVTLDVLACADQDCNRTSSPTSTSPPTPAVSTPSSSNNLNFKIDFGSKIGTIIIFTSIFISIVLILILLVLFLIWLASRRRKKKDVLAELENKVEKDLQSPNPIPQIRSDFEEAEEKVD